MFESSSPELPSKETWEARGHWFESTGESFVNEDASYGLSDQGCQLLGEVQLAFCAGAWVTVLVMAIAVIESHAGEFGYSDFSDNTAMQRLRKRRNSIVHSQAKRSDVSLNQEWLGENEAKDAIRLMFEVFFSDVGT